MESFWQLEIMINIFLQSLGSWLVGPMKFLSFLGQEEFFTIIMPALYWCVGAGIGLRVALMLLISNGFNMMLKDIFRTPRPYWFDKRVIPYAVETSFGFPSGHAQISSSVWGLFASRQGGVWFRRITWAIIFLIGVSRLYLGMHFPSDVIGGWLIGIALILLFCKWEKGILSWYQKHSLNQQMGFCLVFSLILMGLMALPILIAPYWEMSPGWIINATRVINIEELIPLDPSNVFTTAGTFLGMTGGVTWLYHHYGLMNVAGSWKTKTLRYLVGLVVLFAIWYGLGSIFPRTHDFLGYILRFLRYTLVGLWVSLFAPILFRKLNLASFNK